jgi:hypothetical protein
MKSEIKTNDRFIANLIISKISKMFKFLSFSAWSTQQTINVKKIQMNSSLEQIKSQFLTLLVLIVLLNVTGCSTITGSGSTQSISVQTFQTDGVELEGAKCDMTNDEGTWFAITPGSAIVHRSNKDLQVLCRKPGVDIGSASVVSRTKGNMYANIILGGGIGAIVDHNNGTAYEYPGLVKIFMGRANQKIDETSPQAVSAANSTTLPGGVLQPTPSVESKGILNLDEAQKKCAELGFAKGTESFGSCVLKISK